MKLDYYRNNTLKCCDMGAAGRDSETEERGYLMNRKKKMGGTDVAFRPQTIIEARDYAEEHNMPVIIECAVSPEELVLPMIRGGASFEEIIY